MATVFFQEKSTNLYYKKVGANDTNTAVIFLHGLTGSRRQWGNAYEHPSDGYSGYFVDLLGFGYSVKPKTEYTLDRHVDALHDFIECEVKEEQIILVGHSLGAIVALGYAAQYPDTISKVILLALPYYTSFNEAIQYAKEHTKPQYFVVDTLLTKLTCLTICHYGGSLTRKIAPQLLKHLPSAVATDTFLHTYNSYISTLYNVIYHQDISNLVRGYLHDRIFLLHGDYDNLAPLKNVQKLATQYNVQLQVIEGVGHDFPIKNSADTYVKLRSLLTGRYT